MDDRNNNGEIRFTVLEAESPQAKTRWLNPDGSVGKPPKHVQDPKQEKDFRFHPTTAATPSEFFDKFSLLVEDKNRFIVAGTPVDGLDLTQRQLRRSAKRTVKGIVEPKTLELSTTNLLTLDIDRLQLPGADVIGDPVGTVERVIRLVLGESFTDVSCTWQFTASQAPTGDEIRLRLFFFLETARTTEELTRWGRHTHPCIDTSVFRTVQPIYTANPRINGPDWLPVRQGFIDRERDTVELVIPEFCEITPKQLNQNGISGAQYGRGGGRPKVELSLGTSFKLQSSGRVVSFAVAMTDHVGEQCHDPFQPEKGANKCIIYDGAIFSHLDGGKLYTPGSSEVIDPEVKEAYFSITGLEKRIRAARKSPKQKQWAWVFAEFGFQYMGYCEGWAEPLEFFTRNFTLSEFDTRELAAYCQWRLAKAIKLGMKSLQLDDIDLLIERGDDGKFPLEPSIDKFFESGAKVCGVQINQGNGKSSILVPYVDTKVRGMHGAGVAAFVHRILLSLQQKATLPHFWHYHDQEPVGDDIIITLNSLLKLLVQIESGKYHTCIIDEAKQIRQELLTGDLLKDVSEEICKCLATGLQKSKYVFLLDADLNNETMDFWCHLSKGDKFIIAAKERETFFKAKLSYSWHPGRAALESIKNAEGKCAIFCESERMARAMSDKVGDSLLITGGPRSETLGAASEVLEKLSEDALTPIQNLIYNTKMGTGISIEDKRFKKGVGLLNGFIQGATDNTQMARRERTIKDFDFHISMKGLHANVKEREIVGTDFKHWQARAEQEKTIEKSLMALVLPEVLKLRGFEVEIVKPYGDIITTKEAKREDIAGILEQAKRPILIDYIKPSTTDQLYEKWAYGIRDAFGSITPEGAEAYCSDRNIIKRVASLKMGEGDTVEKVHGIVERLSRDRIPKAECLAVLREIRAIGDQLRASTLMPTNWRERVIPSDARPIEAIGTFLTFWGFKVKPKESSLIVVSCVWRDISSKADEKAALLAEVLEMHDIGWSYGAIAKVHGIGKSTVRRWVESNRATTPVSAQEVIYTSDDKGGQWHAQEVTNPDTCNDEIQQNGHPLEVIPNTLEDQPTETEIIGQWIARSATMPPPPALTVGAVFALNGLSQNQRRRYLNRRKRELAAILSAEPAPQPPESQLTPKERLARAMVGYPGTRILMGGDTG